MDSDIDTAGGRCHIAAMKLSHPVVCLSRSLLLGVLFGVLLVGCSADEGEDGSGADAATSDAAAGDGAEEDVSTGAPPGTTGTLRLLTYNVHGLPPQITGDDTKGRMVQISPLLGDYDIVGLQEDFIGDNHALLVADVPQPVIRRFDEKLDDARAYGSGLGLLLPDAVVDARDVHYQVCHGFIDAASDCLASKGFQSVRLQLAAGVHLDLYNTHFEAGSGTQQDLDARAEQVGDVIDALGTWSAGRAAIFMGDTNLRPSDGEVDTQHLDRFVDEAGMVDACTAIDCAEPDHIDRFFLRGNDQLELEVLEWRNEPQFFDKDGVPLSDHPAIAIDVRWAVR
jgi:endonuclease/exonuclease/phosphatase family metal-dependent hydrolase